MTLFRLDLTHYKEGWGGSHEFQTGFFLAPNNKYDAITQYANQDGGGWSEYHFRMLSGDENDPSQGAVPFYRWRRDEAEVQTIGSPGPRFRTLLPGFLEAESTGDLEPRCSESTSSSGTTTSRTSTA